MGWLKFIINEDDLIMLPLFRQRPLKIGREEESNDIVICDPSASRVHAEITFKDGSYCIEDVGSSYGTYINDVRISAPTQLRNGDFVLIGCSRFQFIKRESIQSADAGEGEAQNLVQCPNALCGEKISLRYQFCPHCGTYTASE